MFGFINPKIVVQPSVWWIIGGIITGSGITIGVVLKVITMGFISRKDAIDTFQDKEMCDEKSGNLEDKSKELKDYMCGRFDTIETDIKTLLTKK